jgi:hypothetical protein
MTDITLSPTVEPAKPAIESSKLPRLGFGKVFGAMLKCYGDALAMAYGEPVPDQSTAERSADLSHWW